MRRTSIRRRLQKAAAGVYEVERIAGFTANHHKSGARTSLSDYYTAAYGRAVFDKSLKEHIVFSDHSLATDSVFAEVQLVSCRNVLIYFDRTLQDRALGLFHDSLCRKGFLGIGSKESMRFSSQADGLRGIRPRTEDLPEAGRIVTAHACTRRTSRCGGHRRVRRRRGGAFGAAARIAARTRRRRFSSCCTCRGTGRACWPRYSRASARCPCAKREDKESVAPGTVYFAPTDYHLLLDRGPQMALSADDPVHYSRPSIDVLFESAADVYGERLLGIILTGANEDGAAGLAAVMTAAASPWCSSRAPRGRRKWACRRSSCGPRIWCCRSISIAASAWRR